MSKSPEQTLVDAVARNAGIVLLLPSDGLTRSVKSRFLADAPDGLWVELEEASAGTIDALIKVGQPIGVAAKCGHEKMRFATLPLRREAKYALSTQISVQALLLARPQNIVVQQRRNDYRVSVPEGEVAARVWRIPEHVHLADRPSVKTELHGFPTDISIGGIGFTAVKPTTGLKEPPKASVDERVRVELTSGGTSHLFDSRVVFVHPQNKGAKLQMGIAFQKLEDDLEGRRKLAWLTQIVGRLQREEVRRAKLA